MKLSRVWLTTLPLSTLFFMGLVGLGSCGGDDFTPSPVRSPTPSPIPTRSPTPRPSQSASPSPSPSAFPSPSPSPSPSGNPFPSPTPSSQPSPIGDLSIAVSSPGQVSRTVEFTIGVAVSAPEGLDSDARFVVELFVGDPLFIGFEYSAGSVGCSAGDSLCAATLPITIPSFVQPGTYDLVVNLTDGFGNSASDEVSLDVL